MVEQFDIAFIELSTQKFKKSPISTLMKREGWHQSWQGCHLDGPSECVGEILRIPHVVQSYPDMVPVD